MKGEKKKERKDLSFLLSFLCSHPSLIPGAGGGVRLKEKEDFSLFLESYERKGRKGKKKKKRRYRYLEKK